MGKKEGEKGKEDGWQREGWREARGLVGEAGVCRRSFLMLTN